MPTSCLSHRPYWPMRYISMISWDRIFHFLFEMIWIIQPVYRFEVKMKIRNDSNSAQYWPMAYITVFIDQLVTYFLTDDIIWFQFQSEIVWIIQLFHDDVLCKETKMATDSDFAKYWPMPAYITDYHIIWFLLTIGDITFELWHMVWLYNF